MANVSDTQLAKLQKLLMQKEATLEVLMGELKETFGCSSLEEGKQLLLTLEERSESIDRQLVEAEAGLDKVNFDVL